MRPPETLQPMGLHSNDNENNGDELVVPPLDTERLLNLVDELGVVESVTAKTIREQAYAAEQPEEVKALIRKYHEELSREADNLGFEEGMRAQIGVGIATAVLFDEMDMPDDCDDMLYDMRTYAQQTGSQDVVIILDDLNGK